MKIIKVAFSRPRMKWAVISWIIRWFEGCAFSHAVVRWDAKSLDRELVYHATHGMGQFMSGQRFDAEAETVTEYELDCSEEEYNKIVQKCVDLAGAKYGILQLWGMAFERLTGIRNPFRDGERSFVCSELVGVIIELREGDLGVDLELAGPKLLEERVRELPGVRKVK